MAGKDQHYDPRFLLKGFMSRRDGKKVFVWCFAKGATPVETSTRNIGHAHLFYGRQGPGSLDARITIKETYEYSVVVEKVRTDQKIHPCDTDILTEFVYFQAARTRSTREQYHAGLVEALKNTRQQLGTTEGIEQFYQNALHPDNTETRRRMGERVQAEAKKLGRILSYQQEQILIRQLLRKHGKDIAKKEAPINALVVSAVTLKSLNESDTMIKETHNKALENLLDTIHDPGIGLNRYRQLQWRIQKLEDNALILGDAAVLYGGAGGSHLFAGLGKGNLVLLPLSHSLLLIGAADDTVKVPSVDEINRNSAELSLNFFISRCWSQKEAEYHKLIGKRAPTIEKG